jgi:hypothetical protein
LICLRIGKSAWRLWTLRGAFGFYGIRRFSRLVEEMLPSHEGLCCVRLGCERCMRKRVCRYADIARRNCIYHNYQVILLVWIVFSIGIMCKQATVGAIHVVIHGDLAASPLTSVGEPVVVSWLHDGKWRTIVGI